MIVCASVKWVAFEGKRMFEVGELLITEAGCFAQRAGRADPAHRRILIGKSALERHHHVPAILYKLEWTRWSQMRVTDFLGWQAALVRECASPRQFVTTDFAGMMKRDVNEESVASFLDIPAVNNYHGTQDHFDGAEQSLNEDFARSLKHSNFLVTETNAQTTGWSSAFQFPPYDGQLREDV